MFWALTLGSGFPLRGERLSLGWRVDAKVAPIPAFPQGGKERDARLRAKGHT